MPSLLAITTTALVVEQLVERSFIQRLYTTGIFQRVLLVPSCHDLISLNSQIRRVGSMMAIEAGQRAADTGRGMVQASLRRGRAVGWRCCSCRRSWA